ncbi:hypothetical protein AKJ16_DCAP05457 [Drosera capensis]
MRQPFPVNLAVVVVSFVAAAASFSSPPPPPKATTADLLAVLGPARLSTKVNPVVAKNLRSCFKFLVPFDPRSESDKKWLIRRFGDGKRGRKGKWRDEEGEDELVWEPPRVVMELARIVVDSGGDVGSVHRKLDPTMIPVPDVEDCKEDKCVLTRTPYGRVFINEELNSYLAFLFQMIASRGPTVGLNVSLNRYDLFHGHMFIAVDSGRLGILFHAKEYPAYDKKAFPYNMGYCQVGSDVPYDDEMNLRNILWLAPLPSNSSEDCEAPGVLVVLDARPDGIIYRDLVSEYVQFARTLYEVSHGLQPSLFAALGFSISWLFFRLLNMKKRRTPEIVSEKVSLIKEAIDEAEDRVVRLEERHDRLLKEACSYYLCNRESSWRRWLAQDKPGMRRGLLLIV